MELRHLRYFIAVSEELSFRKAAARLGMAQPPLSNQIADLEREIGVQLISRRQRQISLTEAGRAFLAEARQTVEQADKAVQVAQAVARGDLGSVRLGYSRFTRTDFLPWLLRAVAERHPRIELLLRTMSMQSIADELEAGTLDLGLLRLPIASSFLECKVILRDKLVAVLPADHVLARQKSIALSALRNETFLDVARRAIGQYTHFTLTACRGVGFTPKRKEESDSLLGVLGLIAARRGIALLPASLATYAWPDLAVLPLSDSQASADLVVAWRKERVSALCEVLVQDIAQHHRITDAP
jgi:DNA-binding transcriptional LysR family regulator